MSDDRRFQVNRADVAAKIIDGEAIVMNISSGAYYSITGAGADIWELLEAGRTTAEAVAVIAGRYDVSPAFVSSDLERLLTELLGEDLLRVSDRPAALPAPPAAVAAGQPYQPPTFEKFTDMAEMLALDPPMPELDEELFLGGSGSLKEGTAA